MRLLIKYQIDKRQLIVNIQRVHIYIHDPLIAEIDIIGSNKMIKHSNCIHALINFAHL